MMFKRWRNRWIVFFHDMLWVPAALVAAFWFRFNLGVIPDEHVYAMYQLLFFAIPVQIFSHLYFKLYRGVWHYASMPDIVRIVRAVLFGGAITFIALFVMTRLDSVPRAVLVLYPLFLIIGLVGSRLLYRWHKDRDLHVMREDEVRVLLIGAGRAGELLIRDMLKSHQYYPIGILDDHVSKHGQEVHGTRVLGDIDQLDEYVSSMTPDLVIFAIPSATIALRNQVLKRCDRLQVKLMVLPGLHQLAGDLVYVSTLRDIDIEDLLGRESVAPDETLLEKNILGKVVMVTGAGGSIGSELCRQILKHSPSTLVLFEQNEFALYEIEKELRAGWQGNSDVLGDGVNIVPILGSVLHQHRIEHVCSSFAVQTIYHAAAYKHVPLVEYNPVEGVQNNVFGTWRAANAAIATGVETFVLISTDKAVRPTNVMGASKRLAELLLQALAAEHHDIRICMVRFGNVLGSSGSVVPLFRKQIKDGGPVTVTHADITRYFMTIPEASQLVIQAGAMGQGGDVFVLDMGESVKIVDLATKMIHLSGLTVRNETNPNGDIEIAFSGLRPGEKLYEELLIGDHVTGTEHPRIMRAQEDMLCMEKVRRLLDELSIASRCFDVKKVRDLLLEGVGGYRPQCEIQDLPFCWNEKKQRQRESTIEG